MARLAGLTMILTILFSCSSTKRARKDLAPLTFQEIYEKADYVADLTIEIESSYDPGVIHRGSLAGFAIKYGKDVYILTAGHIMGDGSYTLRKITANFKNSLSDTNQEVEILGYHLQVDVALLKFKDPGFKFIGSTAEPGDSSKVKPLDQVLAVGTPFGDYPYAPTLGYVTQMIGPAPYYPQKSLILHTAPINPGNSGGPLIDANGTIVGINVMLREGYNTMSMAVPINDVGAVLDFLAQGGQVSHPALPGATFRDSLELREIVISEVSSGSPAEKIGLKSGDVLVSFNGLPPASSTDVEILLSQLQSGQKAALVVRRNGQQLTIEHIVP